MPKPLLKAAFRAIWCVAVGFSVRAAPLHLEHISCPGMEQHLQKVGRADLVLQTAKGCVLMGRESCLV